MKAVYSDVDNTLIFSEEEWPGYTHLPGMLINSRRFAVNTALLTVLQDCHARGHQIVLWSAGGRDWAKRVIVELNRGNFVSNKFINDTICLSKPDFLFDDKDPSTWLPMTDFVQPPVSAERMLNVSIDDLNTAISHNISGSYNMNIQGIIDDLKISHRRNKK